MKRSRLTMSPFIILLIPVLLVIGLLSLNPISEEDTERFEAATCFRTPTFKGVAQVLLFYKTK
jgi:hypothetical protein